MVRASPYKRKAPPATFQCPCDGSCLFLPGFPLEGMKVVRLRGIKRRDPVSHEVLASLLLALRRHLERNATLIIKLMCKSIQKFSLRLLEDYISSQNIVRQCIFLHTRIVKCNIYEHNDICTGYFQRKPRRVMRFSKLCNPSSRIGNLFWRISYSFHRIKYHVLNSPLN